MTVERFNPSQFSAGDIVTREGDDRHIVVSVTPCGESMKVRCVKAPAAGWIKVGETEDNLTRRYSRAGEEIDADSQAAGYPLPRYCGEGE